MKILDINNMLDAAHESKMPDADFYQSLLEQAAHVLALSLARHLAIRVHPDQTRYEHGCGGLCASFHAASRDQACPQVIHEGDPGGDWEDVFGHPAGPDQ